MRKPWERGHRFGESGNAFCLRRNARHRHSASAESGCLEAAEWVFLLTGGMTVAYMLKLFIALFVEKHPANQRGV